MKANRGAGSGPELALRRELRTRGMLGYRLNLRGLPGRPDVVFTRFKLAIFVQGCFWHRCPICNPPMPKNNRGFWKAKFAENRARDTRQQNELMRLGWSVLEVWECELKYPRACSIRIERHLAMARDQ